MRIAIWGTGKYGKYVYDQIKDRDDHNIVAWVDSNLSIVGNNIEGILVISPEEALNRIGNDIEIVLVAFQNALNVLERINNVSEYRYGFVKNIVFRKKIRLNVNLYDDKNIIWNNPELANRIILPHLQTNIVDYCNLNCRGCSHFSNLYHQGDKVPFDVFYKDLEQLAKKMLIMHFEILGGEALLEDNIINYIEAARKLLPDSEIFLSSNGILIPKQTDRFFRCCIENDITLNITGYRPTIMMKEKIENTLNEWNIDYFFNREVSEFGKNIDLSGNADKAVAMKHCRQHECHFFRYGKLYKCPFEALGNKFFEHYKTDIRLKGGIDIYDESVNWKEAVDKLCNDPVDSCRYCGPEEKMEWSIANNPQIDDWIISFS